MGTKEFLRMAASLQPIKGERPPSFRDPISIWVRRRKIDLLTHREKCPKGARGKVTEISSTNGVLLDELALRTDPKESEKQSVLSI